MHSLHYKKYIQNKLSLYKNIINRLSQYNLYTIDCHYTKYTITM